VTGERLCCVHLQHTLCELGYEVDASGKYTLRNLRGNPKMVWIIIGASAAGFWRDTLYLLYCVSRHWPAYAYIHNASWKRFLGVGKILRRWAEGWTMVVLTAQISEALRQGGFNSVVLPNSLTDPDFIFSPPACRKRLLWLGSVTLAKGFETAYAAYQALAAQDPEWHFDVFGTGECYDHKERYSCAHFHGFAGPDRKLEALREGGIFVLPSAYVNETQPLAIIEALAHGLPVVASDLGGIPEMLNCSGLTAGKCLSAGASPGDFAEAVRQCLAGYELLSQNARNIFEHKFSRQCFVDNLRRIVKGLPTGRPSPA